MSETKPCGIISLSVCSGIISVGSPLHLHLPPDFKQTDSRGVRACCHLELSQWEVSCGTFLMLK